MATAELLKPDRYEAYEKGAFVTFDDVPLFDEHEGSDGTVYDKELLQHICDNMNFRVEDTGDYAAIASSHTNDDGKPQPEVLGFAGPFRLKKIGNKRPRWCIHGKCHVFKEHEKTFRDNPRRSVELWPEDKPENRYFDPIAVLGAESPRRALGLIYSKQTSPKVERYAMAAAPGGTNTCVPEMADVKPNKPERYGEGAEGALSEDVIDRLIEAMKPVIRAIVAEMTAPEGEEDEEQLEEVPELNAEGEEQPIPKTEEEPMATATENKPEQYAKLRGEVERYRKEAEQYKKDLTALQTQYAKLNERVAAIDGERRQAIRHGKLKEKLDEGYCFELDEEIADTAEMSDAEFDRHIKRVEKYSKVPLNMRLPIPPAEKYLDPKADAKAEQYAKRAGQLVQESRKPGRVELTFAQAYEQVKASNGAAA